jgi:hypothetical protein
MQNEPLSALSWREQVTVNEMVMMSTLYLWSNSLRQDERIGGVMVRVLAFSVKDCGFKSWSSQTKDYKNDMCCFSADHAALRRLDH